MNITGKRIGIVVSRWNELITNLLLDGALETLETLGNPEVLVVKVPGTWEIPPVAKHLLEKKGCDGIVALGCILQGQTSHAQLLASDVGSALMGLQVSTGKPVSWGILTVESVEQAMDRSGLKLGNKGREAASACAEIVNLLSEGS